MARMYELCWEEAKRSRLPSPSLPSQTERETRDKGMETKKTRASLRFFQFFRVITIYRIVSGFVTYK
jgi:hypothetical protein